MNNSPLIRALLVSSESETIAAIQDALHSGEHKLETRTAVSFSEALGILASAPFDFIICDLGFDEGNAGDLALRFPDIPCIALASSSEQEQLTTAFGKGLMDFLDTDNEDWAKQIGFYVYKVWNIRRQLVVKDKHVSRRYEDLVQALPDIVYELDIDGRFTFINQAVKILGYTPDELIGKHFETILFEEDVPYVSRSKVLPLYEQNRTGARNAPKLFDERRGVDRKTENLELRIKKKDTSEGSRNELIGSVISYGEIASAGSYRHIDDVGEKTFVGTVGIIRDITLRRRSEDMLRKMYQAVDQSPAAVAILDQKLIIEYVNPAFFNMTGSGPDAALGSRIADFLGSVSDPCTYEDMINSIRSGMDWRGELLCPRETREPFWVSVMVSSIRTPSGSISHYLCLMEDITRKHTLEDLLKNAKEEAEAASRAKSEFLANISRELKNPLSSIITTCEELKNEDDATARATYIETIRESGDKLLKIVTDLLDLSKIEARDTEVQSEDFPIRECMETLIIPYQSKAEEKGLEFSYSVDDGGMPVVNSDQQKICRILGNLVSNAVRFTEKGGIDIRCAVRAKDDMPALFVSVQDTGIGISGTDQQKLFKHFSKIDTSCVDSPGGTGLGLAISKELALKLGGDISVESTPDFGSTFSFYVPLGLPKGGSSEEQDPLSQSIHKLCILVAEDNPVNSDYLRFFLEKAGHKVELVSDGYAALEILQTGDFDAVILDVQMSGLDGLSTLASIRSYTGVSFDPRIPVIALTAYNRDELSSEFQDADFDGYISKPLNSRKLISTLDTLVRQKEYFDISRVRRQYMGSEDEFKRLLFISSQDLPKRLDDFIQARKDANAKKALLALETMVGILSPIGAIRAQQLIKRFRKAVQDKDDHLADNTAEELVYELNGIKRQVKHSLGEL